MGMVGGRSMTSDPLPELLLTPDLEARNILARMCRETILRQRRNRQAGQYRRQGK